MGTLKLIFDFKFPLLPSLFVIKKEPERGAAAAADYKLEIHILATFKTLGGSQIILGRLSILLYLVQFISTIGSLKQGVYRVSKL